MHLVLVNQYFPPDEAPTGLMLEAVARALVTAGHQVTVLCAKGGYAGGEAGNAEPPHPGKESARGVAVIRIGATAFGRGSFAGKLMDYASFYGGVGWKLLTFQPRPGRVVALTTPPYLSVLARIFSKLRGADHAHWVMDLYPDVMVAHGMLTEGGIPQSVLAMLARRGFGGRRCAAVVTLGPDMAERVSRHLPAGRSAEWVPLWSSEEPMGEGEGRRAELEAEGLALRRERGWGDDELILMYSGNMGLGHRFGEILEVAGKESPSPILHQPSTISRLRRGVRFVFYGRGKRRREIEHFIREHPDAPVELHDYVPRNQLAAHLRSADVHLASLEPSWSGTMLPSKLQGIFAAGRPVIYFGSRNSSTARWIEQSGGGWVVEPGDARALPAAIEEAGDPGNVRRRGEAAARFHREHFDREVNVAKVANLLAGKGRA